MPTVEEVTQNSIERARQNANENWLDVALRAGKWLASKQPTMTSEDIREVMSVYYPHVTTPEPRAMGAAMKSIASAGYIEATGEMKKSGLSRNHNRPQRVWRSLIYS